MSFLAMENSKAGSDGDAAQALGDEYQVFLSFRGLDTRHGFTDFLYHGLINVGVRVFRDEDELQEGEVIGNNLLHAINNSILYIPIFSHNYASSKWCLRELALMTDNMSKSEGQKSIFPIFFDVEPEDVKLKTPLYNDALLEHEKKFPNEVNDWRKALEEVNEIKGWNVKRDQSQAKIVESVVEKVLEKLETRQKFVPKYLVGLDDRVKHLTELLDVNHREVRLIGIYGMGGIGKTTIAKEVFNHLSFHFGKRCSFLEDVREGSSTKEGIVELQKKLLSNIVGSGFVEQFMDSDHGMRRIEKTLSTKKALVVLDDVDKKEHIKKLIGNSSLHSGSRIIITTRNIDVLQFEGFKGEILPYEMLKMDDGLGLQLFCRHAFDGGFPSDDYHGLSSEIVSSMGGHPLTIEVIGSSLKGKKKAYWEETLDRIRNVPEEEISKKLRVSYDGLTKNQQQIFLDIACFFFNEKKSDASYMWAKCSFYPEIGIDVLISRCLIKILDNKFWMHDQLVAMGRQIVREESPDDLGKQSRLWIQEEALQIIRTGERKDKVQALSVIIPEITNEDFEKFPNLRLLELREGTYAGDFARCHSNLRWLSWHSSPEEDFRANHFSLDRLVVCKLYTIKFKDDSKALDLIKRARDLKVLSFTQCYGITTIPDISKCLGLERLTLERCSNLERIESFIGDLQSLIELKIEDCADFTNVPKEVGKLVKLEHFSLSGCDKLTELPGSIQNLTSLTELDLSDTTIRELPNFIGKLKSLRILRFTLKDGMEDHEWQLPSGISTLVNLQELDLAGHNEMKGEIPDGIGELSSLRILNLESTGICGIPWTINMLHNLQTLNLSGCHEIQKLPELPTSLTCLHLGSESLLSVPNLSNLTNLVELLLSNYKCPREKSKSLTGCNLRWIGRLSRLKKLKLNLVNVPGPPDLASLSHLQELFLSCLDLETQLPSSLLRLDFQFFSIRSAELLPSCLRLTKMSRLEFHHGEVEDIPLDGLPQLEMLIIFSCKRLQRLSIPLDLRKLREVSVSFCPELVEIQVVGLSKSLKSFSVCECKSLTRINGLSYLKNLENLAILCCNVLTAVGEPHELESLKSLETDCPLLRRAISLKSSREEILVDTSDKGCDEMSPITTLKLPGLEGEKEASTSATNKAKKTKTEGRKKATSWWKKIRLWRTWKKPKSGRRLEEEECCLLPTPAAAGTIVHDLLPPPPPPLAAAGSTIPTSVDWPRICFEEGLSVCAKDKENEVEKDAAVPKFGEWCESNPASADGYTHIFNKVREEMQGRARPEMDMHTQSPSAGAANRTSGNNSKPESEGRLEAFTFPEDPWAPAAYFPEHQWAPAAHFPENPWAGAFLEDPWEGFCIEKEEENDFAPARLMAHCIEEEEEEEEKEKEKEKVVVFKLDLHNEKDKKKAIKLVSGFAGVKSFSVDMEDRELMVIGDIDAVLLASELREWFDTHLMSIEAAFRI